MQLFGRSGYGPKMGDCALLGEGELGPHLTQCDQGRGLPACQYAKFHLDRQTIWPQYTNVTDRTGQTDRTDNGLIA